MACEKEINMLRREVEAAKKRYQDLKDEKETLVDQQVGSSITTHILQYQLKIGTLLHMR